VGQLVAIWRFQPRAHGNPCFGGPVSRDFLRIGLAGAALVAIWRPDPLFMTRNRPSNTRSELLRSKLSRGLGHNSYGEQAWPNDLLYMFPISILGIFGAVIGLATLAPTPVGEPANPYATPYEILPEWFLFPTLQTRCVVPNKLLGITAIAAVPVLLM
jgi:quinol-cytochrome oxidoreductase complex cytochrome b subunit